jgi:hypothetical protein
MQKSAEKSTFEEIWAQLDHNQRRFVIAMQECPTKAEAAKAIGVKPNTIYKWPEIVDEAIQLLTESIADAACEIIAQATAKAAMIKVIGLDSGNERIRQDVASEILDRRLGTAVQKSEVGLDESTRQLLAPFFALAARCITEPDKMKEFKTEIAKMAAGEDA